MVDLTDKYVGKDLMLDGKLLNPNYAFLVNEINNYDIFVLQGGTRCFSPSQKILTDRGSIPISEVKIGDTVPCYNEHTKKNEDKKVLNVMKFQNQKPTVKIKLKSGHEIVCSADHKFYHNGEWVEIQNLLK